MLRGLKINNLALIESLHLVFSVQKKGRPASSLAVLTGETGAGKSIILQALNLLSACKAAATWIRTGADTATVEAFFDIQPDKHILLTALHEKGFEVDDTLILKRIISRHGRSRYFINDSMATAALVEFVSENLFSVASQHEHQILLNPRHHLDFIDSAGSLWNLRTGFGELFSQWSDLKTQQQKLQQLEQDREQRRDLLSFQLNEISESQIKDCEDEALAAEKKVLKSSDMLMELGSTSYEILSDIIVTNLGEIRKNLDQMAQYDEALQEIAERISSSSFELDDLTRQLNQYLQDIPSDPVRLEEIEERIDLLQRLKRKYGGPQNLLSEVIKYGAEAEQELAELDTMDQKLTENAKRLSVIEKDLSAKAAKLSEARKKTASQLEKTISRELSTLSFATPEFNVRFETGEKKLTELSPTGWDHAEFMFSANPGEPVKPLVKIASGGELSRLLLGLKCILARRDQVGTVIFDEVDAGIGGQAAEDIAAKIKELSEHHQVLCITHLPQIASKADEHFKVDKTVKDKRTLTRITLLDNDKRVTELARMLAGESVTDETLAFAKKILQKGSGHKEKE
ncbi:DNA repair protein RecN [Thermodesulfobacteriota bacterium]